jgi:hypothetical protein
MPEKGSDESRIRRALSQDVATNLLDTMSDSAVVPDPFGKDPRVFFIADWPTENAFRDRLFECPDLARNEWFRHQWDSFRTAEVSRAALTKADVLTFLSMVNPARQERYIPSVDTTPGSQYWVYYENLGPQRSGQLEEVVGPMGSGKSNFLAWKIRAAIERGHAVVANFHVEVDGPGFFREAHRLTDAILQTIEWRKAGYTGIVFWVIDEQGANLGGASGTTTTLEGRWAAAIITKIRKLGTNLTRCRQQENIPAAQLPWVSVMIRKTTADPALIRGQYLTGPRAGGSFVFTLPSQAAHYDTNTPASWAYDLDVEAMDTWLSRHEGTEDVLTLILRYTEAAHRGVDLLADELAQEAFEKKRARLAEAAAQGAFEDGPGREPVGPDQGGKTLRCSHCGHEWLYRGRSPLPWVACTSCGKRVRKSPYVRSRPGKPSERQPEEENAPKPDLVQGGVG